jgi:polysaccharide biosynthesis protein PslH
VPYVVDEHNVESQIFARYAASIGKGGVVAGAGVPDAALGLMKLAFRAQAALLRSYEARAVGEAWGALACSEDDRRLLAELSGQRNLAVAPNGVDLAFFGAPVAPVTTGHLVLTGSMDWPPNEDAAIWFCSEVLGEVRRQVPDARFYVVGRNPTPRVQRLAQPASGAAAEVVVTGTVPDVRPYLAGARCLVVPLRVGGGTRLKIVEAFAAGVPVVSTRVGAEGIACVDEEHILYAETPAEFARQIGRLAADPALGRRLGASARALVEARYGWSAIVGTITAFYERAPERFLLHT